MESRAVLHLTVGLPGTGKTTLARRIEADQGALRLTPDEWMLPLFGTSDAEGRRDVLEGRLLWVAHRVLSRGVSVILDFGCWSAEERHAIRDLAEHVGARFELHYLNLPETERRARADARRDADPDTTFAISATDHDRFEAQFEPPTKDELAGASAPEPPTPSSSWAAFASTRWPSLPRWDAP